MGSTAMQLTGAALLLALGELFLPLPSAEAYLHIRKPEVNLQEVSENWQPLIFDKGGIYSLKQTGAARIWLRLEPDKTDSVQAASVIIRYQKFNETSKTLLKHYYLCPRLGLLQQLNEVRIYPGGGAKTLWQRSYDFANWVKPVAGSPEASLLQYVPSCLDPKNADLQMTTASVAEVRRLAEEAKEKLWQQAGEEGREPKLYLHWTAEPYGRLYPSYHINIDYDGTIYLSTGDFSRYVPGTWKRNVGAVNLTICGCKGSNPRTLGPQPPTEAQIETMARVIAALADGLGIPVDKQHVLTHGEAANNEDGLKLHGVYPWWNDSYGDKDTRGDLEYLGTEESPAYVPKDPQRQEQRGGAVLRAKARKYQRTEER